MLSFTYPYVGLPALDGEHYVAGDHLLGVALTALMHVPPARRAVVHAEALRRLAVARENDYRRFLLLDCLEAYAAFDAAQAQELESLLRTERYREAQAMPMTSFEKGLEQGQQQGLEQGQRQGQRMLLEKLLDARFGPLGNAARERLEHMDATRLDALALELFTARSLRDLGLED